MPLEQAPNLEEINASLPQPESPPPAPAAPKKWLRWALLALTLLLLAANFFWNSNATAALRGRGGVRGRVVNEAGHPLLGEALILGTNLSATLDENGGFELQNVPAGPQSLIILDAYSGYEARVEIRAGETVEVGEIHFQVTAEPGG